MGAAEEQQAEVEAAVKDARADHVKIIEAGGEQRLLLLGARALEALVDGDGAGGGGHTRRGQRV